jgi:3-deoxy-D-manno-octulosonic-acid transferase
MIYFYRVIYFLLKSFLLLLRPVLGEPLQKWTALRTARIRSEKDLSGAYWFHASSGEIEYGKPLIRKLKETNPNIKVVVTYSSPSAEKLFANISGFVDEFIPMTWDEPKALHSLFEQISPSFLLFSRTDLWPELIYQAKKRNIPTGIFSFNPKFGFLNRLLYKKLLKHFSFISCIDEISAEALKDVLPGVRITGDGDTRFDQVFFRLSQEPKLTLTQFEKLAVFGSTWPQDEAVILKTLIPLSKANTKIVLSPHDVNDFNLNRLRTELSKQNLKFESLSDHLRAGKYEINFNFDVLLIDKIGFLADCYRFADFAFVGGSFKDKVHSVMEPLCCGLKVAVGPFFKNSPEAVKYHNRFVFAGKSSEEMLKIFEKISTPDKSAVTFEMKKNLNATQKILEIIQHIPSKI